MVVIPIDIMSEIKTPPAPRVESSHAIAQAQFLADYRPCRNLCHRSPGRTLRL